MISILYFALSAANLVCFIMVLIKLFKAKGALHGILGLICGLYTFIWGWINAGPQNIKNIMLIWTACFVLSMPVGFMFNKSVMEQAMQQGQSMQTAP